MYTDTYAEEEVDQYETYEIVESEAPYITEKRWRNLDGRILPVSANYARTLEADNDRLRAENLQLKEAMARSGNSFFMSDANRWRQRITHLEMKCAKLEGEIYKLQAEKETEVAKVKAETSIELLEANNRANYYERLYRDMVEANARTVNGSRDRGSGQFKREDGLSGDEVRRKALEMYDKHVPFAEIGRKLGVSAETAKKYIREGYQSRGHQKAVEAFEAKKQKLAM